MINNTITDVNIGMFEYIKKNQINKNISPHLSHYKSALLMFADNKFFGIGPKNFRKLCNETKYSINSFSCSTHPHSTWIQILSETGLISFLLFFFMFFYIMKISIFNLVNIFCKKKVMNEKKIILMGAFLVTLWPLIPSGNFFNNWLSIIYFFPVGFYISISDS